ncbi:hypothetical protein F2P81_003236 [Scophthalmus maximus]|uniref:Ephrin RBD domain-containing protein n=1 Tax=Scophthalmus maximus TaxID=52904 RepID=A0A6A4THW8_SCOMX|nr:hypothetical protein F2P81_003236 [Scophthalmus maximus]
MSTMLCQLGQRCVMEVLVLTVLSWVTVWAEEKIIFDRHAVYWNSSNPKTLRCPHRLRRNSLSAYTRKSATTSCSRRDLQEATAHVFV